MKNSQLGFCRSDDTLQSLCVFRNSRACGLDAHTRFTALCLPIDQRFPYLQSHSQGLAQQVKEIFPNVVVYVLPSHIFSVVNAGQGAAAAGCAQHHQERTGPPASGTRTSHAHCKRNSELQLAQSGMCSAFFSQQPTAFCSSREQLSNIYINLVPDAARDTSRGSHHFDTSL